VREDQASEPISHLSRDYVAGDKLPRLINTIGIPQLHDSIDWLKLDQIDHLCAQLSGNILQCPGFS